MAIDLVFTGQLVKNESMTLTGLINFVKFGKYLCGSMTLKVDGSLIMTKQSEHIVSCYFKNAKNPKADCGNTIHSHDSLASER
jgi:hypothetical protein